MASKELTKLSIDNSPKTKTKSSFNANMLSSKQKAELAKSGSFTNTKGVKVDGSGKPLITTKTTVKTTPTSTTTPTKAPVPTAAPAPSSSYAGGSVVDYLKSTGGDISFSARAQLAVKQGIVANAGQYTGTASQNTSLLTKLRSGAKATPTAVSDPSTADAFINGGQDGDIAQAEEADAPPSRSNELLQNFYTQTGITSLVPTFDENDVPDFEATYTKMRKEQGIEGLERSINEYDSLEQDIQSRLRDRVDTEEGKTVAMNVISGRVSEAEKQEFRRLDEIGRAKNRAVNQLQTANSVIETMMNLKQMDYTVAKEEYNREFNRNTQLFSIFKGMEEFDMSAEERDRAAAVSNLNIMYGAIKDGGLDVATMDAATTAKISSLELKAGLPSGFYNAVAATNPEGKVLSTTTRTAGGVKYADVILQNPDGSFSTSSVRLGADGSGNSSSAPTDDKEIDKFRSEAGDLITKLGSNEVSWATAFNSLKAKFPKASNELIDSTLNKNEYHDRR